MALHARTRTQKMQDIVERLIMLTDLEDSIVEGDETMPEDDTLKKEKQNILHQIDETNSS